MMPPIVPEPAVPRVSALRHAAIGVCVQVCSTSRRRPAAPLAVLVHPARRGGRPRRPRRRRIVRRPRRLRVASHCRAPLCVVRVVSSHTSPPPSAPAVVIGAYPWAEACAPRKPAPGFEIALYALALLTLPATVPPPPARALLAHATARPLSPRASLPSGSACLCVVPLPTPLSGISVPIHHPAERTGSVPCVVSLA